MDDASPTGRGFDAARLAQAPGVIERAVAANDLSGAVTLVWRRGGIAQLSCVGRRNIAADAPMERDTLFRIASMSKPVTTAAALMLMEEGKLALEDPITRWAPEFSDMRVLDAPGGPLGATHPAARPITIEDLMTHRAGLAYAFASVGPIAHAHHAALGDVLNQDGGPDRWMKALGQLPLSFEPGERFHYSHATDVLGFIVGRIDGRGFCAFLMDRLFGPLGMKDTDFWVPPEKRARAAIVYRQGDHEGSPLEPVDFRHYDAPPAFCGGGGGLISTAEDYLAFARMLIADGEAADGRRLLRPETVRLMRANRLTEAQRALDFMGLPFWAGQGFGLGLSVVTDPDKRAWMGAGSVGAFGWPGAFGTWWQADPALDLILIYLIQNSMPLGPEAVANMGDNRRLGARLANPLWQQAVYAALS